MESNVVQWKRRWRAKTCADNRIFRSLCQLLINWILFFTHGVKDLIIIDLMLLPSAKLFDKIHLHSNADIQCQLCVQFQTTISIQSPTSVLICAHVIYREIVPQLECISLHKPNERHAVVLACMPHHNIQYTRSTCTIAGIAEYMRGFVYYVFMSNFSFTLTFT